MKNAKTKFYNVSAKSSRISFSSLITNLIFYFLFEIILFAIKMKCVSAFFGDNELPATKMINNIVIIQAIIVLIWILYISFRQKGVFICNDYIEIVDGLIIFRLIYRRKIYFSDIKECSAIKRKNIPCRGLLFITRNPVISLVGHYIFKTIVCFEPFPTETNDKMVVRIVTDNSKTIALSIEDADEFISSVNSEIKS